MYINIYKHIYAHGTEYKVLGYKGISGHIGWIWEVCPDPTPPRVHTCRVQPTSENTKVGRMVTFPP